MIRAKKIGRCVQCKKKTRVQLNNGTYACLECLDKIGKQQKEMRDIFKDVYKDNYKETLYSICCILEIMKRNGCNTVEHCLKSLTALILIEDIKIDKMSPELRKEIKKTLDLFLYE